MKRLIMVVVFLGVAVLLFGCSDPFGATARSQTEWGGRVKIAELEAQASVDIAKAKADAQEKIAVEDRRKSVAWASTMPILFLLVAIGVVLSIGVYWSGRTHHDVQYTLALAQSGVRPLGIEEERRIAIEEHARRTGAYIVPGSAEGSYLLKWPDGSERLYLPKKNADAKVCG